MSKTLVLHSGGADSLACMLYTLKEKKPEDIISLGFNYGQRHFLKENDAACRFCKDYGIKRDVLQIPLGQIGGSSLTDHNKPVTTDMKEQKSTVVPQRNAILLLFAAAYAEVNDCDTIVHGAVVEDYNGFRDCRGIFFDLLEMTIQAGRNYPIKGSDNIGNDFEFSNNHNNPLLYLDDDRLDIKIKIPFLNKTKIDIVKEVAQEYGVDIFKYSYTCYCGGEVACGRCPSCIERLESFNLNNIKDPILYMDGIQ
jgi:7-cyano-7-deazaguanine synthase